MHRPAEAHIVPGVCCIACGYDLQKLPLGSKCPECGTNVAGSLENWEFDLRKGGPWGVADYVILATLLFCAVSMLFHAATLRHVRDWSIGPDAFPGCMVLGACAIGYLCIRYRPLGKPRRCTLSRRLPWLVILVILWSALFFAREIESTWYHYQREQRAGWENR
jgi:hypothetical protein